MTWKYFTKELIFVALLLIACPSWAAHPLITDDTDTQGKGKFQLELNGQYDWDKEDTEDVSVKTTIGVTSEMKTRSMRAEISGMLRLPLHGKLLKI
jgi:hypothetical protein